MPSVCAHCGKSATERCSRCHQVYYCSKNHQRDHWPSHRSLCSVDETKQSNENTENNTATRNKYTCGKEKINLETVFEEKGYRLNHIERQMEGIQRTLRSVEQTIQLLAFQMNVCLAEEIPKPVNITIASSLKSANNTNSGTSKKKATHAYKKNKLNKQRIAKTSPCRSLHEAAAQGNIKALHSFLGSARRDTVDDNGWTALMHAASEGHAACVTVLLEHGFQNISHVVDGLTPLHISAQNGHADCITAMLKKGTNPGCTTVLQNIPLHFASMHGHANCLKVLLNGGSSVNATDSSYMTPLHYAAIDGHVDCVEMLIKNGAKVNSECAEGNTPLHYAAGSGQEEVIRLLLGAGADLRIKNDKKERPMDGAAKYAPYGKREIICSMLKP